MLKRNSVIADYYWENYNRTLFVANKIKELGLKDFRVFDVGGTRKDNLLGKFGIKNITSLNIQADSDIVASAHQLPIKDRSFECVTCIDTLEHIPQELRLRIIRELIRVASRGVFIVAPVNSEENKRAEQLVLKYLSASFIKEHERFGLVDFDEIKHEIEDIKKEGKIELIKEGDLDNLMYWVAMMLGDKLEVSKLYQELYFLENKFHPRRKAISIYLR